MIVKLSSFGKSREQEYANLRYIAGKTRGKDFVLRDETGEAISVAAAMKKFNFEKRITSDRLIISFPSGHKITDNEEFKIQNIMAGRYTSFVYALHRDRVNQHLHFNVQNVSAKARDRAFAGFKEVFDLKRELEGGNPPPGNKNKLTPRKTQSEIHISGRGVKTWREDMREKIEEALKGARDYEEFMQRLNNNGIQIVRETEHSLTFSDAEGNKARANKLFSGLKNREDIEKNINAFPAEKQDAITPVKVPVPPTKEAKSAAEYLGEGKARGGVIAGAVLAVGIVKWTGFIKRELEKIGHGYFYISAIEKNNRDRWTLAEKNKHVLNANSSEADIEKWARFATEKEKEGCKITVINCHADGTPLLIKKKPKTEAKNEFGITAEMQGKINGYRKKIFGKKPQDKKTQQPAQPAWLVQNSETIKR
jgi:histidinol phosphatase-like PHP family hydrolase